MSHIKNKPFFFSTKFPVSLLCDRIYNIITFHNRQENVANDYYKSKHD